MGGTKADLLRGTLDMLVLKALALEPLHGLAVSRRISQVTDGVFDVQPGSLFPALHRLEQDGWVQGTWGESENNRRARYYSITAAGGKRLAAERAQWERTSGAVNGILQWKRGVL